MNANVPNVQFTGNQMYSTVRNHYKQFSTEHSMSGASYSMPEINWPPLTDDQAQEIGNPIATNECDYAIKTMNTNVSPGGDGLGVKWYQFFHRFWSLL